MVVKNIEHKFPYEWELETANFTRDKGTVFSCFACGGGSSLGYKLAGFDVLGCNEIDPKMIEAYTANNHPKYAFLEPIQDFKNRDDLPEELYNLDILDGSPPCSSFSMAGNREKDWGKEKKFREGQSDQILDTLFFDFIDLANKLQPKIVIAENVKGILFGEAKAYVARIYEEFDKAGYYLQHFVLNSAYMGISQRRERVFFIGMRKDLAKPFLEQVDLFTVLPKINMKFNESVIPFREIADSTDRTIINHTKVSEYWDVVGCGQNFSSKHPKGFFFNDNKAHPDRPVNTIAATHGHGSWHYDIKRLLNNIELIKCSSFPLDYDFGGTKNSAVKYLVGMSVPPVMMAQIACRISEQWLSKMDTDKKD